jgi:hypothetical protein
MKTYPAMRMSSLNGLTLIRRMPQMLNRSDTRRKLLRESYSIISYGRSLNTTYNKASNISAVSLIHSAENVLEDKILQGFLQSPYCSLYNPPLVPPP